MQMLMALRYAIRKRALYGALALLCLESALAPEINQARRQPAQHGPRQVRFAALERGVHVERVDFVLDQTPRAKDEEAQNKRKADQRRAAAKSKPNAKTAPDATASTGRQSATAGDQPNQAASSPATTLIEQGASVSKPLPASSAVAVAKPGTTPTPSAASALALPARAGTAQSQTQPQPQVEAKATPSAALNPIGASTPQAVSAGRPPRLTRDQLLALMPGATMLRTNTAGALRQWVNSADGTIAVYWGGAGLHKSHSASGRWNITEEGRFCLHIEWEQIPENWCRFIEQTANGEYQPIADIADAHWTPPADKTSWRPFAIRH